MKNEAGCFPKTKNEIYHFRKYPALQFHNLLTMQRTFHKIRVTNTTQANQFTKKSGGKKKKTDPASDNKKPASETRCKSAEVPRCSSCKGKMELRRVIVSNSVYDRITGEFDAKAPEAESDFTVCVAENYDGVPLVSRKFVTKIQARCWKTKPQTVHQSLLPGGMMVETAEIIVARIGVGDKFYRVQFGVLPSDSTAFVDSGWSKSDGKPDAVIPLAFLCEHNQVFGHGTGSPSQNATK